MAKKTSLTDKVKIRGIRRRWLLNIVGVVLLILVLVVPPIMNKVKKSKAQA